MKKLETKSGVLLFVEVPERAYDITIKHNGLEVNLTEYLSPQGKGMNFSLPSVRVGWAIAGIVKNNGIEFLISDYIDKIHPNDSFYYVDYTKESHGFRTDIECFKSLMKSQGIELTEGNKFVVLKER